MAGISASYLNLIEHDRRRVDGRLLRRLAELLDTTPAALAPGADDTLLQSLAAAAAAQPFAGANAAVEPEGDRVEAFVGAWPGWAGLIARQAAEIEALRGQVRALTDRARHDPRLADSLHEIVSTVTAIRSTAAILAEGEPLDADWQMRFHRNIHADSLRLAEASRALARQLGPDAPDAPDRASPAEIFAAHLDRIGYHVPALEGPAPVDPGRLAAEVPGLGGPASRALATTWFARYHEDALALPLEAFSRAALACDHDPAALAAAFRAGLPQVLRRLGSLRVEEGHPPFGVAVCDGSGALLWLRTIPGFALSRGAAGCPIWPLYAALAQPGRGIAAHVEVAIHGTPRFAVHAVAERTGPPGFGGPDLLRSVMLVRSAPAGPPLPLHDDLAVGPGCRLCPRRDCPARREPSLLPEP